MSGAGIGIMSTELGYALSDVLFKNKGLLRGDLELDSENPSFFSISMGLGLGNKSLDFVPEDIVNWERYNPNFLGQEGEREQIKFRAATVVDAEGAYFFNKYVGIGGRFRVRAMSAKSFGSYSENVFWEDYNAWESMKSIYEIADPNFDFAHEDEYYYSKLGYLTGSDLTPDYDNAPVTEIGGIVKSDHITEFTGSAGFYFNFPLSKRFALGTKALIGRSITQDLDVDGYAKGNVKDIEYQLTIKDGWVALTDQGKLRSGDYISYPKNTGKTFEDEWDYLTLSGSNSTSWGTGLSLTYKYKSNFSWRVFVDYDYTKKTYTLKYDPYHFLYAGLTDSAYSLVQLLSGDTNVFAPVEYKKEKKMNYFTLGMSFLVNF